MRVALLAANAREGDAIGNQLAAKVAFFRERGAQVSVLLEDAREVRAAVRSVARGAGDPHTCHAEMAAADLVLVEYSQFFSALLALPLLRDAATRVVLDYHGVTPSSLWELDCPPSVREGARQVGLVWCADAALVHSAFAQAELCDATEFPQAHVHRLGYPVELAAFRPGTPRRDLRATLRTGPARLLLFVGRLAPNKRPWLLVEALARLRSRTPPVHAVLLGTATDRYAVVAERCRRLARDRGVADRLHLLGQVPNRQLLDAYRSADVLVMPSLHEGFCLPVIEAFACGLPVVAARAGALPETCGLAGSLFDPEDVADLVRHLEAILDESESAQAARRQTAQTQAAACTATRWREQFGQVIEEILHAPRRERTLRVALQPRPAKVSASGPAAYHFLRVDVTNRGTVPLPADGPARGEVLARVAGRCLHTPLPELLLPGKTATLAVRLPPPREPGRYPVELALAGASAQAQLCVEQGLASLLPHALAQANQCQRLPEDYVDVTEGWLAPFKRWLKRKLLGNFKQAYVDQLARQQSEFNRHLLAAVHELADDLDAQRAEVARLRTLLRRQEQQTCKP